MAKSLLVKNTCLKPKYITPIFKVPVHPLRAKTSILYVFPQSLCLPACLLATAFGLLWTFLSDSPPFNGIKIFLIVYNGFDPLPQLRSWNCATPLLQAGVVA